MFESRAKQNISLKNMIVIIHCYNLTGHPMAVSDWGDSNLRMIDVGKHYQNEIETFLSST